MATLPTIWIIVLNWNGLVDTKACLASLRRLHYSAARIVVVDNASSDGSVDAIRRDSANNGVEIIEAKRNLGYAGGNNLGIRHALDQSADFVLVLNNDTTVDPTLLDELLAAADRAPDAGCFGPWIYYMHDPERLWFTRSDWSSDIAAFTAPWKGRLGSELSNETTSTEYVCGAALFFRAAVARKIGLLDERFFLVYEDSDWSFRARRAGFACVSVPKARVWHKVGTSFGSESSPLRTYFSTRNKLLWAEKNVSRREWWDILRAALRRLYPGFALDRKASVPAHKVLLWAGRSFVHEWARKFSDPQEAAHRRGVVDYVFRRFGDCPPRIRTLARAWADAQEEAAEVASLGR
jgi:GT2 family glycosyltransferase